MSQIDRGTYVRDKNRSGLKRGCLGKSLKLGGVALALILVAILTVPSQERMEREVNNAVTLCILANIAGFQDNSDDVVRNMTAMISTLDTAAVKTDQVKVFKQMNQVRIYRHTFYTTARMHHLGRPDGVRVAFGFLGLVIPTVTQMDYILRSEPMRKDYGNRVLGGKPTQDVLDNYDDNYNPFEMGASRDAGL